MAARKEKDPLTLNEEDSGELQVVEHDQMPGPAENTMPVVSDGTAMLQMIERVVMNPDADIDKLDRLLQMKTDIEDREAEKLYARDMVAAQAEMPAIVAHGENTHTNSTYGRLPDIIKAIKPVYTKYGLSLSFGEAKSDIEGYIRVVCDVLHSSGCSKQYSYDCPVDDKGAGGKTNKTQVHGRASAVSYSQRYITKMIFNLAIVGEDDDGNAAGGEQPIEYISEEKELELDAMIKENNLDMDTFKQYLSSHGIDSFGLIPATRFNQIKNKILMAIKNKEKGNAD